MHSLESALFTLENGLRSLKDNVFALLLTKVVLSNTWPTCKVRYEAAVTQGFECINTSLYHGTQMDLCAIERFSLR